MNVAIIPARGGSKRIPRKNIKIFSGKPMISYAINIAIKSKLFDSVIVSTDDEEVKKISLKYGALVPFKRPKKLSDDFALTASVISHAIKKCDKIGFLFANVCCIYPSVPFLTIDDIIRGYALYQKNIDKFCFPVARHSSSILRSLKLDEKNYITPFFSKNVVTRTQDLDKSFYDTGQFYWGHKKTWSNKKNIHGNAVGFTLPSWRAIDIDDIDDWEKAEVLYKTFKADKF